jgi:hypothetical protein
MIYDKGEINWKDFQEILAGIIQTDYNSVVAELIDNSIDEDSSNIKIQYYGDTWADFATIVFDDGNGFKNKENLSKSFNLGGIISGGESIGKFHIGMKLTPLSRCNKINVLCKLDNGEIIHRGLDKKIINEHEEYGTFEQIPELEVMKYVQRVLNSNTKPYKTAIILHDFEKKPKIGQLISADKKTFARKQAAYFGLIYQEIIEENEINIYVDGDKKSDIVIPLDPFYSKFTPEAINYQLENDEIEFKNKFLMKCFREWGTVATERIPIPIKEVLGKSLPKPYPVIHATGYRIPSTTTLPMLPEPLKIGVPTPSGNAPKMEKMGGLWFYREGKHGNRCICFSGTRAPDSNEGWYELHSSPSSHINTIRIKIEFPEQLDKYLDMSPTKDSVDPNSEFFIKIKNVLNQQIDEPALRSNVGDNKIFFTFNQSKEADTASALAGSPTTSSAGNSPKINKKCDYCKDKGPDNKHKPWHHIDTRCPLHPCEICGKQCDQDNCTHQCAQCEVIGDHIENHCPSNCEYCDYPEGAGGHGDDENCPKLCNDCKAPKASCICECLEGCGETILNCKCNEDDDDDDDDENFSNINITQPGVVFLKLVKGDEENQKLITEALEHLNNS